ncbi:hypothetical protein [Nocardia niigatensis]
MNCIGMLAACVMGRPGDWRMLPATANGQPAAIEYHWELDGVLCANGIMVLAATATGVSGMVSFHDPALVVLVGFLEMLAE